MRLLLLTCAFLIVASAGADCLPSKPYVGLFADEAHSITSASPPLYTPFDVWIWCLPSEHGLAAVEYSFVFPSNVVTVATASTQICLCPGLDGCCYPGGYCAYAFMSCQWDWVWTQHWTCMALSLTPGTIALGPPPNMTAPVAANCDPGYPIEPVTILNTFGINQEGVIGVEEHTWGAIKSLYR